MANAEFNLEGFTEFFDRMHSAAQGDFKKDFETFLEGIGLEFLRIIQDEIIRLQVVVTRNLLHSFYRDDKYNVWSFEEDGTLLEVGSSLDYALYVNDGHYTTPAGVATRFVPGHWEDDKFKYDPKSKEGMLLKCKWVEGKHYFDSAFRILEKLFPTIAEAKLQDWLDKYFS